MHRDGLQLSRDNDRWKCNYLARLSEEDMSLVLRKEMKWV